MFFQIRSYIKFLWKSSNEHGVHSPFVFNLVTKCFYDKSEYSEYKILKNYRQSLLENNTTIGVKDFGAGSKVFKSNKRIVSDVAENAGISPRRNELLLRVMKYFNSQHVLEIGTSLGLATAAMSLGNRKSDLITIEGCPETAEIARNQFAEFSLDNIQCVTTQFDYFLKSSIDNHAFDLIFFDGNHTKEATIRYFQLLLPTATNSSVWIFDDIHWSSEMEEAWQFITQHPQVSVTIDTFQWGFVFFRKEQKKEDFIIRV